MISEEEKDAAFKQAKEQIDFWSDSPGDIAETIWNFALAWADPRIREDEREKLAKLAETKGYRQLYDKDYMPLDIWTKFLAPDEIRAGKLEDENG